MSPEFHLITRQRRPRPRFRCALRDAALPEPDDDLCRWLTIASIPAGPPAGSAGIACRVSEAPAARYDGIAIAP